MKTSLSPSNKGLSRGQIGKLLEMFEPGLLASTAFQNTPTAEVDRFVKTAGPDMRDVWTKLLERRFWDFSTCCRVPVNYDEPNAIAKAIEAAKFDGDCIRIPLSEIPLIGFGQAEPEVHEVRFGRTMYNSELPGALKRRGKELGFKSGFRFVDPLTALRSACVKPDRQRKISLVVLFKQNGRVWSIYLGGGDNGRSLDIAPNEPGTKWERDVGFLAVCELPLGT